MKLLPPNQVAASRNQRIVGKPGWRCVRFGDVVDCVNDTVADPQAASIERVVGLDHLDPGSLHIKRWASIDDGTTFTRRFRSGQVLFGKRRAYQRKLAVAEFDGICSGDILVFEPKSDDLLPELLPFIMQAEQFWQHALDTSAGSLSPRTKWQDLARYEFALPPKEEQRRLAEVLWAAHSEVDQLGQLKERLNALRSSFFGARLSKWETIPLVKAADFLDNKRVPLSQKERSKRRGPYPYYGASGVIDHVDDYLFDEPLILLSEDGFNLVNRTTRVAFKVQGQIWVNNHAHVLRPSSGFNIDYLAEYLESINLQPYITGTFQRKLNKSECEQIPIPAPPLDEQQRIAEIIRAVDESSRLAETHAQKTAELQSALVAVSGLT